MKINDMRTLNKVLFKDLKIGDVFTFEDSSKFYMKTETFYILNKYSNAFVLNSGSPFGGCIDPDSTVIKVDCELVIK